MADRNPSSEADIAKKAGYSHINKNVMSTECKEEQLESIKDNYNVGPSGTSPLCGCTPNENYVSCADITCSNRLAGIACSMNCYRGCANNPWGRKTFAIDQGKLYMAETEKKGFGLYAKEPISRCDWLGEYTGVVSKPDPDQELQNNRYLFDIPICGHVLDPLQQGSAMRIVNFSHNPNTEAVVIVHEGTYRIFFEATKDITPNQEITVDYRWKFRQSEAIPECFCEQTGCDGRMGTLIQEDEAAKLKMPNTFENIAYNGSARVQKLLARDVHPRNFNRTHKEKHIHSALEEVAAIVAEGNLTITLGRVIQCYTNEKDDYFYVIRTATPTIKDYHIPMWLVFRHRERAQFVFMELLTSRQKRELKTFLQLPSCNDSSNLWPKDILSDYINNLRMDTIPRFVINQRNFEGSASIGMSQIFLTKMFHQQRPRSRWGVPLLSKSVKGTTLCVDKRLLEVLPPQEFIREIQGTEITDSVSLNYSSPLKNDLLLRRIYDNTIGTLVVLMLHRQNGSTNLTFNEAHETIHTTLEPYYFGLEACRRQYILYSHYRLAVEMFAVGSLNLRWCSLCGLSETFANDQELKNHYFKRHALCGRAYACFNCPGVYNLPSEIRSHIDYCTENLSLLVRTDVREDLFDAMFDYMVIRRFQPGTVDCEAVQNPSQSSSDTAASNDEMDAGTKNSTNVNVRPAQTSFTTETAAIISPEAPEFKYECDVDHFGNLETNLWESPNALS